MTGPAIRRRWRLDRRWRLARAVLVVIALAASATVAVGDRPRATASPTPVSPGVYLAGSGANRSSAQVDRVSLPAITSGPSALVPIQTASQAGVPAIGMAITPDASTAVFLRQDGGVFTVNVASGAISGPVMLPSPGSAGGQVAADPGDSTKVFVADGTGGVFRIDLGPGPGAPRDTLIAVAPAVVAQTIAMAPDGKTAYVGGHLGPTGAEVVVAVPVGGGPAIVWSRPPGANVGPAVTDLALTPDGRRLFGTDGASVFALSLPLSVAEGASPSVTVPGTTTVTVGPNGGTVYAGGVDGNQNAFVTGFPVGSPNPLATRTLQPNAEGAAVSLAVSPDGATLIAMVGASTLYPIPVNGGGPLPPGRGVAVPGGFTAGGGNEVVAITPDQAPTASFVAQPQPAGTAATFDATGSGVAYGSIVGYQWSFGDGATVSGTGPKTAHAYAHAGTFTIIVTEIDSAGTTVPPAVAGTPFAVDGSGQTPYRQASTSAAAQATITIPVASTPPPPPATSPTSQPAQSVPQLRADPTVGPPGTVVTVTGTGFPPNTTVTVLWSISSGSAVATTNGAGDLTTQLLVLVPDVLGPRYAMVASFSGATAPFLVVADGVEPGGSDASTLFRSESP
jgi:hypothetical protein